MKIIKINQNKCRKPEINNPIVIISVIVMIIE
jgi:hypothetical protein